MRSQSSMPKMTQRWHCPTCGSGLHAEEFIGHSSSSHCGRCHRDIVFEVTDIEPRTTGAGRILKPPVIVSVTICHTTTIKAELT